jgi:DNA-binding beta-propeller fold protein YncE
MKTATLLSLLKRGTMLATGLAMAAAIPAYAQAETPVLTLQKSVEMPQIKSGDFDHFGVDLARGKIYTSAQHARTIEVFDLKTGAHLQTVPGFINPHSIFYAVSSDRIIIADGGESLKEPALIKFIDPATMKVVKSFSVRPGPDAAFYDQNSHLFYNGSGGKDAGQADSLFAVFDADHMTEVARTVVPSENIEGMAVDPASHRLFLNLRDQHAIGVFDTQANTFVTRWVIPGMNQNTPIDFDPATHRLFVIGRDPGRLCDRQRQRPAHLDDGLPERRGRRDLRSRRPSPVRLRQRRLRGPRPARRGPFRSRPDRRQAGRQDLRLRPLGRQIVHRPCRLAQESDVARHLHGRAGQLSRRFRDPASLTRRVARALPEGTS